MSFSEDELAVVEPLLVKELKEEGFEYADGPALSVLFARNDPIYHLEELVALLISLGPCHEDLLHELQLALCVVIFLENPLNAVLLHGFDAIDKLQTGVVALQLGVKAMRHGVVFIYSEISHERGHALRKNIAFHRLINDWRKCLLLIDGSQKRPYSTGTILILVEFMMLIVGLTQEHIRGEGGLLLKEFNVAMLTT